MEYSNWHDCFDLVAMVHPIVLPYQVVVLLDDVYEVVEVEYFVAVVLVLVVVLLLVVVDMDFVAVVVEVVDDPEGVQDDVPDDHDNGVEVE